MYCRLRKKLKSASSKLLQKWSPLYPPSFFRSQPPMQFSTPQWLISDPQCPWLLQQSVLSRHKPLPVYPSPQCVSVDGKLAFIVSLKSCSVVFAPSHLQFLAHLYREQWYSPVPQKPCREQHPLEGQYPLPTNPPYTSKLKKNTTTMRYFGDSQQRWRFYIVFFHKLKRLGIERWDGIHNLF